MGETPPQISLALMLFLFLNHIATLLVCVFPDWKHSAWQMSQGLIGRVANFQGVWWQCFSPKWGLFVCDNYGKVPVYSEGKHFFKSVVICAIHGIDQDDCNLP